MIRWQVLQVQRPLPYVWSYRSFLDIFPLKILLCPCRYFAYLATILIICYIQRDASSYREKSGLETAVVHGGLMCEVVADDEPGYVECGDMPVPHINFMKVYKN